MILKILIFYVLLSLSHSYEVDYLLSITDSLLTKQVPDSNTFEIIDTIEIADTITTSFEDANTRRSTTEMELGEFEGMFIEKKPTLKPKNKDINIFFIFSKTPAVFFDSYNPIKKAIVLEFYDIKIGKSLYDTFSEYPIDSISIKEYSVDLNKEIDGLEPDIRTVTKILFYCPFNIPYSTEIDEFSMINFNFQWNKEIKKLISKNKKDKYFKDFNHIIIYGFLLITGALIINFKIIEN